ncbi:MAG: hypothetical protein U5N85_10670 [Arcicella sp.]|nr:hypothetical protein [Arcicella sp.]
MPASLIETTDKRIGFYLNAPDITVGGEKLKRLVGFFDAIDRPIPAYLPDEVRLLEEQKQILEKPLLILRQR